MTRNQGTDNRKVKALVFYLVSRSKGDPRFSAAKLNKLLFYCDFTAYRRLGGAITGYSYQKSLLGPIPNGMLSTPIERAPEVSVLSAEELDLADRILAELWDHSGTEVSDLSHDFIGWKAAEFNEVIPYETVFLGDPSTPVSEDEIEFCLQKSPGRGNSVSLGRDGGGGGIRTHEALASPAVFKTAEKVPESVRVSTRIAWWA
ncbi:MAG TPA: Panacea domain-containing protein [Thermoanaerobaculia bacterium]|nr:Panacea domain-containing protein [Thermoanaerobaculia bacterium]